MDTDLFGQVIIPVEKKQPGKSSAKIAHGKLLLLYGQKEGHKCNNCALLRVRRMSGNYYKCTLFSTSSNPSTDWRVGWQACGKWEEEFCEGCGCRKSDCVCPPKEKRKKKIDFKDILQK